MAHEPSRLKDKINDKEGFTESLEVLQNKTIMKIEYDMTHMGYNTCISSLMILVLVVALVIYYCSYTGIKKKSI